jgi:hypothetical protein
MIIITFPLLIGCIIKWIIKNEEPRPKGLSALRIIVAPRDVDRKVMEISALPVKSAKEAPRRSAGLCRKIFAKRLPILYGVLVNTIASLAALNFNVTMLPLIDWHLPAALVVNTLSLVSL